MDLATGRVHWQRERFFAGFGAGPLYLFSVAARRPNHVTCMPEKPNDSTESWSFVDARTGRTRGPLPEESGTPMALSPDGSLLALVDHGPGKTGILLDTRTGKAVRFLAEGPGKKRSYCQPALFSPDGRLLLMTDSLGVSVWECRSGRLRLRQLLPRDFYPREAVITPAGRILIAGWQGAKDPDTLFYFSNDPPMRAAVWDVGGKGFVRTLAPVAWGWALALSPDGRTLAVSSSANVRGSGPTTPGDILLYDIPPGPGGLSAGRAERQVQGDKTR
jgi:hypothetical protein